MIEVGAQAPEFALPDHSGKVVSLGDFTGQRLLLVFYPLDFSPVCTDQLKSYEELGPELKEAGVSVVGISVDSAFAHKAFRDQLGISTSLLADFEPKGAVAAAYGAYLDEAGHSNRSLVLIDAEGTVEWVYETDTPLEIPSPRLIRAAIQQ